MRAATGSVLVVAVMWMGCGGGASSDATVIASGLNNPTALLVVGDHLFWIEDGTNGNGESPANSTIRTMPSAGGTPTTVLAQAYLDGNLTSDGTLLYFSYTPTGSQTSVIASCGLDGSDPQTLSSGVLALSFSQGPNGVTDMYVVNGTLYFEATPPPPAVALNDIYSLPTTGGAPSIVPQLPSSATVVSGTSQLNFADSSGLYFSWLESEANTPTSTFWFSSVALGGSTPNPLDSITVGEIAAGTSSPLPPPGGVVEVNGTVFFLSLNTPDGNSVSLQSVPATGGSPTTVASYSNQNGDSLTGDANGLYMNNTVNSNNPGIFSVTLSGAQTAIYTDDKFAFSTSVGNDRHVAIDSKNVYWVGGGFNSGQGTLHSHAR